ncbi:MAG: class I SAM-dependent methyltransferase, partial [Myxococcales bacterium]|nr:class I SAM-dependent methyltransferase [Myxococcales bacterium]
MGTGTQFGLSHRIYRDFRPPYPDSLYRRVFASVAEPRTLAVDLGAGTGLVSAVLGQHFARVCAVEPDPAMASILREAAPDTELVVSPAEQADFTEGSVDLVTCANAFHWMDVPVVARSVARWLRPGGIFAGWRYPMPTIPERVSALVAREMPRWLPFRHPGVLDMDGLRTSFGAHGDFEMFAEEL